MRLAGTLFISEKDSILHVQKLVLSPEPGLQLIVNLPSPEPPAEDKRVHAVTGVWASNRDVVLLQYEIYTNQRHANWQVQVGHTRSIFSALHSLFMMWDL